MKMTVGQLRRLVREMKLGISDPNPPARAWADYVPDDDEPTRVDIQEPTYIATVPGPDYTPDPETLERERLWRLEQEKLGMHEPWDPEPAKPKAKKRKKGRGLDEEVTVQHDPFPETGKKPTDLRGMGNAVLKAEQDLSDVPSMLNDLASSTSSPKTKAFYKNGAGLAYHALNDLKALEAIITIVAKQRGKS